MLVTPVSGIIRYSTLGLIVPPIKHCAGDICALSRLSACAVASCRGMGRQAQLVACNVAGFWVIGTLTGYLLAFNAHLGVSGLWIGINAGVFSCGEPPLCVVPYIVLLFHWLCSTLLLHPSALPLSTRQFCSIPSTAPTVYIAWYIAWFARATRFELIGWGCQSSLSMGSGAA